MPPWHRWVTGVYFSVVTIATLGYGASRVQPAQVREHPAGPLCACAATRPSKGPQPRTSPPCAGDIVPQTSLEMLVDSAVIALGVLMWARSACWPRACCLAAGPPASRHARMRACAAPPPAAAHSSALLPVCPQVRPGHGLAGGGGGQQQQGGAAGAGAAAALGGAGRDHGVGVPAALPLRCSRSKRHAAAPPTASRLPHPPHPQLFRDKMESVNAWLHASALPKSLKQRIRAYYAGGGGLDSRGREIQPVEGMATVAPCTEAACAAHSMQCLTRWPTQRARPAPAQMCGCGTPPPRPTRRSASWSCRTRCARRWRGRPTAACWAAWRCSGGRTLSTREVPGHADCWVGGLRHTRVRGGRCMPGC